MKSDRVVIGNKIIERAADNKNANLSSCTLEYIDFSPKMITTKYSNFHGSGIASRLTITRFENINFSHSTLSNINFDQAKFLNVNFDYCKIIDCSFEKSKLLHVSFNFAITEKLSFANSSIENSNMIEADLPFANFYSVEVKSLNMHGSNIKSVNFDACYGHKLNLSATNISSACNFPVRVKNITIVNADISDLNIIWDNIINLNMLFCNAVRADFTNTRFYDASFIGNDFTDVNMIGVKYLITPDNSYENTTYQVVINREALLQIKKNKGYADSINIDVNRYFNYHIDTINYRINDSINNMHPLMADLADNLISSLVNTKTNTYVNHQLNKFTLFSLNRNPRDIIINKSILLLKGLSFKDIDSNVYCQLPKDVINLIAIMMVYSSPYHEYQFIEFGLHISRQLSFIDKIIHAKHFWQGQGYSFSGIPAGIKTDIPVILQSRQTPLEKWLAIAEIASRAAKDRKPLTQEFYDAILSETANEFYVKHKDKIDISKQSQNIKSSADDINKFTLSRI